MLLQKFKESAAIAVTVVVLAGATMMIASAAAVQADGNDSPNDCLTTQSNVESGTLNSGDEAVYTADADKVVDGVCIKSGDDAFEDKQHSVLITDNGVYGNGCYTVAGIGTQSVSVTRTQSNDCKNISHIDVIVADKEEVDYCDPSERPNGMSIAEWLADNNQNGSDCFEYVVDQVCGMLDAQFTQNQTGFNYNFRYVLSGDTPELANFMGDGELPVSFDEDEDGGEVTVTFYAVGEEADYFTGFGIPNVWDGNGQTVDVDTDCEDENNDDEDDDNGQVLGDSDVADDDQGQVLSTSSTSRPAAIANTGAGAVGNVLFPLLASLPAVPFFKTREE